MKVFVEELYAGMEITESEWYRDFEIEDPDDQDPKDRIFEIVTNSLEVSDPSLESLENPFSAEANGEEAFTVEKISLQNYLSHHILLPEVYNLQIKANFQPTKDMTGFFTFQVRVTDGGGNYAVADAQVVIIATENQIFLTFNNKIEDVTDNEAGVS